MDTSGVNEQNDGNTREIKKIRISLVPLIIVPID
jgi:hypothetical protein